MGDPPTWVGVTRCGRRHGGGRRRFRPTDPVGKNVNLLCGFVARWWDFRCVAHF
mgnify:FL=1